MFLRFLKSLYRAEDGGLIAAEYLLIGTLLTIGLITGIAAVREAVTDRLEAMAELISPDDGTP